MTDKERLLELLASFRIQPTLQPDGDTELVELNAKQGGVEGYTGFQCVFSFRAEDGSFLSVTVWE